MAYWTNQEQRRLVDLHNGEVYPTRAELVVMFPRHTLASILTTAFRLGLKRSARKVQWMRIAHGHFSKRETEMRPSNGE